MFGKKKLSPLEQESKLKVLQECMDMLDGSMSEGIDAKKAMKATVIASSKDGLKKGLEKAEDVVSADSEGSDMISGEDAIMDESEDEMTEEGEEELSLEEIKAKMEELQEMLQAKMGKKSNVKAPF